MNLVPMVPLLLQLCEGRSTKWGGGGEVGELRGRNLHMVCNAFMNWVFNNLHYQFNTLNTNYLAHMLC